ncbi:MAG TPA: hypothetical protein VE993_08090 [Stellaceae bacterium]|nr:hypothetical protein [Stellaceae bacterium]
MSEGQKSSELPTVKPGQIWFIEHASAPALFRCDHRALTSADVVLYDRALAPVVAPVLSIGTYAEPLSPNAPAAGPAISPRALGFAAEGWSVAQLVETHTERRTRLKLASAALMSLGCASDLPVLVIAKATPDRCQARDACLRTLPGLADEFAGHALLTLIFGPLIARYPAQSYAFAANGLAG